MIQNQQNKNSNYWTCVICSTLFACLLLLGCPRQSSAVSSAQGQDRLIYQAQESLKSGHPRECIRMLKELDEQAGKRSEQFSLLLGNAWYALKDWDKARQAYQQGLRKHPKSRDLTLNHSLACYQAGEYAQAGRYFLQSYDQGDKSDPDLLYRAGSAFFLAGEYARAEQILEKLLNRAASPDPKWMELLLRAYRKQGKDEAAEKTLGWLVKQDQDRPEYWRLLAGLSLKAKKYKQAAAQLELAYRLDPPSPSKWSELADLYLWINAPLKAAQALLSGYGPDPEPGICARLARCYARSLRYQQAVSWLDRALSSRESASLFTQKARILYRAGEYRAAVRAAQKSLRLDPDQGRIRMLSGYAAWHLGRFRLAKQSFQQARKHRELRQAASLCLQTLKDLPGSDDRGRQYLSLREGERR